MTVRTEDHPLDYAWFEGTVPEANMAAARSCFGTTAPGNRSLEKTPRKTLPEGHLHFILHGRRMQGEWILFRLKPRGKERQESWILRKVQDDYAGGSDDLVGNHLTSIDSGRTMEEIAAGKAAQRRKAGAKTTAAKAVAAKVTSKAPQTRRRKTAAGTLPPFEPVQLAALVDHVPPRRPVAARTQI